MKFLIASDLHGSAYYTRELLEAFAREKADRMILLGDILYHGPRNDLPRDYAPKEVMGMLNPLKDKIYCVRGNCEAEVDQMVLEFPVLGDYMLLPVGEHLVFVTHGHLYHENNLPPIQPGDVLLHGHTHIKECREIGGGIVYLNPGSVSLPKDGTVHSYMTLEGETFTIRTMEGEDVRVYRIGERISSGQGK